MLRLFFCTTLRHHHFLFIKLWMSLVLYSQRLLTIVLLLLLVAFIAIVVRLFIIVAFLAILLLFIPVLPRCIIWQSLKCWLLHHHVTLHLALHHHLLLLSAVIEQGLLLLLKGMLFFHLSSLFSIFTSPVFLVARVQTTEVNACSDAGNQGNNAKS